jgi:hypothetical protein
MLAMNYMYVINTALRVCVHELIVWLAVFFILWMASLSSAHFLVCHDAVLPFILRNLSMACVLYIRCSYLATYQWLVCYILDVSIDLICTVLLAGLSRRSLLNWSNDRRNAALTWQAVRLYSELLVILCHKYFVAILHASFARVSVVA